MLDFMETLGVAYQSYRAFQDAGGWMIMFDMEARQAYIESWLTEKGYL